METFIDRITQSNSSDILRRYTIKGSDVAIEAKYFKSLMNTGAVHPKQIELKNQPSLEVSLKLEGNSIFITAIEYCKSCNGTGDMDCKQCNGTGDCECSDCGTTHSCGCCDGDGVLECDECENYIFDKEEIIFSDEIPLYQSELFLK